MAYMGICRAGAQELISYLGASENLGFAFWGVAKQRSSHCLNPQCREEGVVCT